MKNFLIKFLGGYTKEDYKLLEIVYQAQRDLATTLRNENSNLITRLGQEISDKKELQSIIFKRFGIVSNTETPSPGIDKDMQPLRTSPLRWSQLKGRLEADDNARARFEQGEVRGETQRESKEEIDAQISGK